MFARWTSDFDCGYETEFWYVIKDDSYNISTLKSKKRYEITKARKNFCVKPIDPADYAEELYEVQAASVTAYPLKYRPTVDRDAEIRHWLNWNGQSVFGAFLKDENGNPGKLCGYTHTPTRGKCVYFSSQKTIPETERLGVNAALVDGVLTYFSPEIQSGKFAYFCDGPRNLNHETEFQNYLEKYFGFRKAYCKLHMRYRPGMKWIVNLCYLFRKPLRRLDGIGAIHKMNAVLKMEEIARTFR